MNSYPTREQIEKMSGPELEVLRERLYDRLDELDLEIIECGVEPCVIEANEFLAKFQKKT